MLSRPGSHRPAKRLTGNPLALVAISALGLACPGGSRDAVSSLTEPLTSRWDAHWADWDGDGYSDTNVWRGVDGTWPINGSQSGYLGYLQWGRPTDVPLL